MNIILREVFALMMGVVIMVGVSGVFSQYVAPPIYDLAMQEQVDNSLRHANSFITKANSILLEGTNSTLELKLDMPSMISSHAYRIYINETVNGTKLCNRAEGFEHLRCVNVKQDVSISGTFYSGTKMLLSGNRSSTGVTLLINNAGI